MALLFSNNASTTLAGGGITNVATSLTVATGAGALFPTISGTSVCYLTVTDGVNIEIVKATARSSDVFTIVRGQDGTTGTAFSTGATVALRWPNVVASSLHQATQADSQWTGYPAASDPGAPSSGNAIVWLNKHTGRPTLRLNLADAGSHNTQAALWQRSMFRITPGAGTVPTIDGGDVIAAGTCSHPSPDTVLGRSVDHATAATANATSGIGGDVAVYMRGNSSTSPGGWWYAARVYVADSSYGSGATGARIFVGLTDGTMTASVGADDPGGHAAGFTFSTNASDTTWSFSLRDGSTRNKIDTTVTFTAQHVYDFFSYCANNSSTVFWRVDDLTAATIAEGNSSTNVPGATTALRFGIQLATLTTTARHIRYKQLFIETQI